MMRLMFCLAMLLALSSCAAPRQESAPAVGAVQSTDRWTRIERAGTITFGVLADSLPFSFRQADGRFIGFEADLARAIAHDLKLKAELVPLDPAQRLEAVTQGRVDAVIATLAITRENDKLVDFSLAYFQDGQGLLCRKESQVNSYLDLAARKVAVVGGSPAERCLPVFQPEVELTRVADLTSASAALEAGRVEAVAADYLLLLGLSHNRPGVELRGRRFTATPYGIAMAENQSRLRDQLNGALQRLWDSGGWQEIYQSWFGEGSRFQTDIGFHIEVFPK